MINNGAYGGMSGRDSEPCFRRSVRKTLANNKQRDWGQVRVAKFHYATGPKISLDFFIPHLLSQYLLQHLVLITEGPEQGIMPFPDMKKKNTQQQQKTANKATA